MKKMILAAGIAAMCAGAAFGTDYTTDGNNLDLTPFDAGWDGTLGSMAAISLNVPDAGTITDVNVLVDIAHTWAGDLVFKLQAPDGSVVDLMSRPGDDEPDDGFTGFCCGNNADFVFGNSYLFDDAAATSSETIGDGGGVIASGSWFSSGFMNTMGLTTLNGKEALGDWTLYVGDGAAGDNGVFDGFTLQITATPTPGALALLGLAGLAGRRRRR